MSYTDTLNKSEEKTIDTLIDIVRSIQRRLSDLDMQVHLLQMSEAKNSIKLIPELEARTLELEEMLISLQQLVMKQAEMIQLTFTFIKSNQDKLGA